MAECIGCGDGTVILGLLAAAGIEAWITPYPPEPRPFWARELGRCPACGQTWWLEPTLAQRARWMQNR